MSRWLPPFWQNLSALQTRTYNIAKFVIPILNPWTKNVYKVKDSFGFAEDIFSKTLQYRWAIWTWTFYQHSSDENWYLCQSVAGKGFLAANVSYFIFSGLLYKQFDGVAMGSWTFLAIVMPWKKLLKQLSARI